MLPVPTLAALLLFTSITVSYAAYRLFRLVKPSTSVSSSIAAPGGKPVEGLVDGEESISQLGRAGTELGVLALITWLCENRPIFDHENKLHDMDLFTMIILVAFLFAFLFSVHTAPKDQGILNRDQTEEWRGFMQMVFLLYHYFAMEEVYPLIRLFISCYVFLTGFGNTSFFYLKRDYSIVRLLSMLWRLCFSCFVLAMTHNNPIILYYIVPLHTFYFLVSYVTMSLFERSVNYTRHGLQLKLVVLGMVLFAVWEFPSIFEILFSFLSNEPHPGAPVGAFGTRYEWQFRSGLDHYSSFFGMVFACGFPLLELRETNAVARSFVIQVACGVTFILMGIAWYVWLFPLPKFEYNARHAYTFVFPMCAYLFLRNLTPYLRRVHLGMFAFAGKYTLETYLLQHHVWLTSNAKTVLVLLPGFPKANFVLVSIIYFVLSVKLYDLTVKTKSLLIPANDGKGAMRNLTVLAGVVGLCFALAQMSVIIGEDTLVPVFVGALTVFWFLGGLTFVKYYSQQGGNVHCRNTLLVLCSVFAIVGVVCGSYPASPISQRLNCNPNEGAWVKDMTGLCGQSPQSNFAYCASRGWAWSVIEQKKCGWKRVADLKAFDNFYFIGDEENYALAVAKIYDSKFRYSAKNPSTEFADGRIHLIKNVEKLKTESISETSVVVCQTEASFDYCRKSKGIAMVLRSEPDTHGIAASLFAVDVHQIKSTAPAADKLDTDLYREDVYDVVAQVVLNYASRVVKKPSKGSSPPPGGLAHNPLYGLAFLLLAYFALFMGDGYLGLVALFSRILGYESNVTWEKATDKVHANVPGLHSNIPADTVMTPVPKANNKDPEHLSDADDTSVLIQKS